MTREELYEYIKVKKCYCICAELKNRVIKNGIDELKSYDGMICGAIEDMLNRYNDIVYKEKLNGEKWSKEISRYGEIDG